MYLMHIKSVHVLNCTLKRPQLTATKRKEVMFLWQQSRKSKNYGLVVCTHSFSQLSYVPSTVSWTIVALSGLVIVPVISRRNLLFCLELIAAVLPSFPCPVLFAFVKIKVNQEIMLTKVQTRPVFPMPVITCVVVTKLVR